MKKWKVTYERDNNTTGEIVVKGGEQSVAQENAKNYLATNENANCTITSIEEIKE